MTISQSRMQSLLDAQEWDPFSILGPHKEHQRGDVRIRIRAFLPDAAEAVCVLCTGKTQLKPMELVHPGGMYEVVLPEQDFVAPYLLRTTTQEGKVIQRHDPYAFPPVLTDFDLHLFGEGKLYKAYEKLGAHVCTHQGVAGVNFVVWAPNAKRVSTASSRSPLLSTSFLNEDGSMATVVMNQGEEEITYKLYIGSDAVEVKIPPHAMQTLVIK